MAEAALDTFYDIARQFGTPCEAGERLDEVVARILTEVMRRTMEQDRVVSALAIAELRSRP